MRYTSAVLALLGASSTLVCALPVAHGEGLPHEEGAGSTYRPDEKAPTYSSSDEGKKNLPDPSPPVDTRPLPIEDYGYGGDEGSKGKPSSPYGLPILPGAAPNPYGPNGPSDPSNPDPYAPNDPSEPYGQDPYTPSGPHGPQGHSDPYNPDPYAPSGPSEPNNPDPYAPNGPSVVPYSPNGPPSPYDVKGFPNPYIQGLPSPQGPSTDPASTSGWPQPYGNKEGGRPLEPTEVAYKPSGEQSSYGIPGVAQNQGDDYSTPEDAQNKKKGKVDAKTASPYTPPTSSTENPDIPKTSDDSDEITRKIEAVQDRLQAYKNAESDPTFQKYLMDWNEAGNSIQNAPPETQEQIWNHILGLIGKINNYLDEQEKGGKTASGGVASSYGPKDGEKEKEGETESDGVASSYGPKDGEKEKKEGKTESDGVASSYGPKDGEKKTKEGTESAPVAPSYSSEPPETVSSPGESDPKKEGPKAASY